MPLRVFARTAVTQPDLPASRDWPAETVAWWQMWADEPVSTEFRATDWSFLLDTALLHAAVWEGQLSFQSELRLRVSKMAATMEDRARLRITFAQADEAESRPAARASSARDRRGPLTAS